MITIEVAAFAVTLISIIVSGADYLIRSWLQKHREENITALNQHVSNLNATVHQLTLERDKALSDYNSVVQLQANTAASLLTQSDRVTNLAAELSAKECQLAEMIELKDALNQQQRSHDNRINRALKLQGAIWTQKVMKDPPRFVSRLERKTPIVSVINLKGGVGKTTLSAYLAWALAARGYRILLIDLDLQGSLSSLFLHSEELSRLGKTEELLQHFLAPNLETGSVSKRRNLLDFAVPVPQLNEHCRLVATSDKLAYAELSQTVRWLLRVGGTTQNWDGRHDGRMILRKVLHRTSLYKKFDLVLMDCPPLLNLCCSNALAASDSILIPVTPSPKAIERVPPLLSRVVEVRKNGVNPELNVLGVLVNRTEGKSLSPREEDLFVNLPEQSTKVFGQEVDRFDTVIQQRVAVQNAEEQFVPPEEGQPLRVNFEVLAEEFIGRLKLGAPRQFTRGKKGDTALSGGAS